jgi:hypothetical protein
VLVSGGADVRSAGGVKRTRDRRRRRRDCAQGDLRSAIARVARAFRRRERFSKVFQKERRARGAVDSDGGKRRGASGTAAATSFAKAQASTAASDAQDAVTDGAGVDDASDAYSTSSPISGFTGGPFDGSSKSVPGLAKRVAIFYNARPTAVSLYWVDFDGNEVHYVDVHPQHQGIVKTFQMHIWIVRELDSSRFVAQYTVGDEDTSTQSFTIPTS